jgi:hypothetical protein
MSCSFDSRESKQSGVRISSLRLMAADFFIDFRYQVTDPEKASTLLSRSSKAYLIDQATGKECPVIKTKLGPMRSTATSPKVDRQQTIIFTNLNKVIKKGSKVTVVIGDFKMENLTVE